MKIKVFNLGLLQANCYLISKNSDAVIIDPGHSENSVTDYIRANKFNLRAVILTHGHFDHIAGVDFFAKQFNAPVYIHNLDKAALYDADINRSLPFLRKSLIIDSDTICFGDGENITFGDLSVKLIHTPGHTLGGACIEIGDALFTGDTLFAGSIGRTDFPGGSESVILNSLRKLKDLYGSRDMTVYPGHGPSSDMKTEINTNIYFRSI